MNIEHLSHWSGQLNREMYVNRYGHAGIPVVVFASSGGSHNEYYDFGMIDACARFIEEGRIQFFTLSSVDSESWCVTGRILMIEQKCTELMNGTSSKKPFLLSSTKQVGLIQ